MKKGMEKSIVSDQLNFLSTQLPKIIRRIYRLIPLTDLFLFHDEAINLLNGYLTDTGYIRSLRTTQVVDRTLKNIPWCSYPFIHFIDNRLNKNMCVFEFGCGSSTLYYANKVGNVTSVEHDNIWYSKLNSIIRSKLIKNVSLHHCSLYPGGGYSQYAKTTNNKYDIIVVDGRDRNNCIINSVGSLREAGILILDNAERKHYQKGIRFLLGQGFKCIEFDGVVALGNWTRTSVFYRTNNVLNI